MLRVGRGLPLLSLSSPNRSLHSTDNLRTRVLDCIQSHLSHSPSLVTGRSLPRTIDVTIRGLSLPLLEGYLRFCVGAGRSLGGIIPRTFSLPVKIQRWTVLSSPHVHKTAWTQLERRTFSRTFGVFGMHPEVVPKYLWYIKEHIPSDTKIDCSIHEYVNVANQQE